MMRVYKCGDCDHRARHPTSLKGHQFLNQHSGMVVLEKIAGEWKEVGK